MASLMSHQSRKDNTTMNSRNGGLSLCLLLVLLLIDVAVASSSLSSPRQESRRAAKSSAAAAGGVLAYDVQDATESVVENVGAADDGTAVGSHRRLQSFSCPNAGDMSIEIQINPDIFDEDVGWTLANACGTGSIYQLPTGFLDETNPAITVTRLCVPGGVPYTFTITDANEDGMVPDGTYKVLLGGSVVATGSAVPYTTESKTFGAGSCPSGVVSAPRPVVTINHMSEIPMLPTITLPGSTPPNSNTCPTEIKYGSLNYKAGDRASKGGFVFECASYPNSLFCSQEVYIPDLNSTTAYWKQAWTLIGPCTKPAADVTPVAPQKVLLASALAGCPTTWAAATKYKENDQVSVFQNKEGYSNSPLAVYKCNAWQYSLYCGQVGPLHETNGINKLAWTYVGDCTGTISPTASPTFSPGTGIIGCPAEYKDSNTFKAGDKVSRAGIVYECRQFPSTGYCNQKGSFAPGEQYDYIAWVILGPCAGTLAPTVAPTEYSGSCTYLKAAAGGTTPPVSTPVGVWSASTLYVAGDQVRIGATKFQCKPWPFYLWCRISNYKPTLESTGMWTEAWTPAGTCPVGV